MPYRLITVALTLCVLLLFIPLPSGAAQPGLDALEQSLDLLQNGDVDAARAALTAADDTQQPDSLLISGRAVIDLYLGQYATAESGFRLAVTRNGANITALWGLSLCLLRDGQFAEAKRFIDQAVLLEPDNPHLRTIQAYICLDLDLFTEGALSGKIALEHGETSAFLYAVMGQIQSRLGVPEKAVEYGRTAAKSFEGMDFLASDSRLNLSLTPSSLDKTAPATPRDPAAPALTDPRTEPAATSTPAGDHQVLHITSPKPGSSIHGAQTIQISYTGATEVTYIMLLVDRTLRGIITELPYQFQWDSSTTPVGEHEICARAYDYRGLMIQESTITITTAPTQPAPVAATETRLAAIELRMMSMTMPAPTPVSLFTEMGHWYKDAGNRPQAIAAFEKAAAIDPDSDSVLDNLALLYQENGLHSISRTGEISRGPARGLKQVALTFDDGPNPMYTPTILAELKRYGVHATFFVVGRMAQQYPDQLLDIIAQGHEIANHSYTHPNLTKLKTDELIAEVLRDRVVIKDITGRQTYYFRPPGGQIDEEVTRQLRALDYNIIYWSINAGEYRKNTSQDQANKILNKVEDGSIILLHDGPVDGTINILSLLLTGLTERGYSCVTISELMNGQ